MTVCLSALSLLALESSSYALDLSEKEIDDLVSGKLLKKRLPSSCQNGFYGGTGLTIINSPADAVWKVLLDWKAYPEIFPRTIEAKEISRKADRSLVRMKLGYRILHVKYYVDVVYDADNFKLSFSLVSNHHHDIDSLKGYWRLLPQNGKRTLVVYGVAAQAPAGIVNFLGHKLEKALERNLIGLPQYLKEYLESSPAAPIKEPTGEESSGEEPAGEESAGEESVEEDPIGEESSGKEPSGKESSGKESSGKESSGKEPPGKESSGKEPPGSTE